jgi:GAF domain-containing protein
MLSQRLVSALAEDAIHVETATSESELFDQLQTVNSQHELVLLMGQLENPGGEKKIISQIWHQYPGIEMIALTASKDAWQAGWPSDSGVYCTVDREASSKILALVIKAAVRHRYERQRNQALQAFISAAERVGVANTEEQLYQELYEEASELLPGLDGFLIAQYDAQGIEVSFPFSYKHNKRIYIPSRRNGNGIAEYIWLTKEPLLLSFGDEIFRLKYGLNPPDDNLGYCSSEIVAPMLLEGRKVYGAVFATTDDPDIHYTVEHLQVLTTFTNQAALTIRNFIQIKEANQLRDATAALAGQHGREDVLRAIVEGAHKIVNSDFTGLILQDENGKLEKAQPVIPEDFFDNFGEARQEGGLTRAVLESRRPMNIPDTSKNRLVKDSVLAEGIKSMLVLPLIHDDRVLGVLYTHTFAFRDFVARDVALWTAFATQAASALDRVLEEEQQIRDYQRLLIELGSLEEHLSFKETLVRVATAARSVFDSDTCRLFYIDPFTGKVVDIAWAEGDSVKHHVENMPRSSGSTQYVLRTKQPYFYPDMKKGPHQRGELLAAGLKSSASLPLRYGTRDIGVLHCNYFTRRATFNEHYRTLMEAFGARAAVALVRAAREHRSEIWRSLDREIINCTEVSQLYQLFTETAHKALGADFSIFYPYDPTSVNSGRLPLDEECVRVGSFRTAWQRPRGGRKGGVFKEISKRRPLLIVNELDNRSSRFSSHLARREGVRAFVAMRLEVILPETKEPNLAGILFLNYRQPAAIQESDLKGLRISSELIAAGILQLSLQADLQKAFKRSNDQLGAVIEIFRTHESKRQDLNLNHIAERATLSLGLDVCTIIEFDTSLQAFKGRGNYGLRQPEYGNVTLRSKFKDAYMYKDGPTVILDVRKDPLMRVSQFVKREGIRSTVVYPLRVEGESLGLLFGNYRRLTEPSKESLEAFKLFADVAAHVVHQTMLNTRLNEKQLKEERQRLLVWVSMVEDMWQHTLVQKASTIRNHAYTLLRRLERHPRLPDAMASVPDIITEMDRLAADIANAPPRVPIESEMKKELIPISPLLQEIAEREVRSMRLRGDALHSLDVNVKQLGGVQVYGYRRWLIYVFESLFQNAYAAMPRGGKIIISGNKQKHLAEIRIQDTGKGVPRRLHDKLFQIAITGRRNPQGLGIGSLLATTLVEENGGTIELEKPGPGDTTVLIRLPIGRQAKKQ